MPSPRSQRQGHLAAPHGGEDDGRPSPSQKPEGGEGGPTRRNAQDGQGVRGPAGTEEWIGESRWPPAVALLCFMAMNIAVRISLPDESAVRVPWLLPVVEAVLLSLVIVGLGNVPVSRRWVRRVSVGLVAVLVAAALWATVLLIRDLIEGTAVTQSPGKLLASGAVVWVGNNLAFAL